MDMGAEAAQRQQILGMLPDENTARLLLDQFYVTYGWLLVFGFRFERLVMWG